MFANPERPRILLIRRDNIGDLVLTTPAIALLRRRFPAAHLAALVNSYNAPVLAGNPDLDEVFAYTKGKHCEPGESLVGAWLARWRLMRAIRGRQFDVAIVATPAPTAGWLRLARASGARHILAAVPTGATAPNGVDLPVATGPVLGGGHAAEQTARLLAPLGIDGAPPPGIVRPEPQALARAQAAWGSGSGLRIGLHISARKPRQRWPADRWPALMAALDNGSRRFALFWSPGAAADPRHPGDDDTAAAIAAASAGRPLRPMPSPDLATLIAGLASIDLLVCSDGGAMHLAAALGKPIVCFFGNSEPSLWHPWGVSHRLLRPPSETVADITVDEAAAAAGALIDATVEASR